MLGEFLTRQLTQLGVFIASPQSGGDFGLRDFWLPRQGSTVAKDVDASWDLVYWVSIFFFILVTFLLFLFMVRYRASKQHDANAAPDHNTPLEVFWTVVPTAIVVVLFWQSYKTYMDLANPPLDAYEINVTGQKWNWLFEYPNGYIDADLHVPIGTPVVLTMTSPDVMHSFYVPEFRVKRDIIPGRYTKVWFEADGVGVYDIFCTEYCGTEHSSMMSRMVVHELADYHAWLEEASDFISRMPAPEAGEMLYNMRGCKQCHSVDGASGIGPTFQGLYGREEVFTDGTSLIADENYIQNSIYEPQAQIVAGYDPVMPTYRGRLKEEEVRVLIEYIKTLK